MNFHAKALLAFLAFHVIVTAGGLMFDQVPQALGQGVNDAQLVGTVGMDDLSRVAWKLRRRP
jgi:hypothetical protein